MELPAQKVHDREQATDIADKCHEIVDLPLGNLLRVVKTHLHAHNNFVFVGQVHMVHAWLRLQVGQSVVALNDLQTISCVMELSLTEA